VTRYVARDVCTVDYSLCTLALTARGDAGYKRKKRWDLLCVSFRSSTSFVDLICYCLLGFPCILIRHLHYIVNLMSRMFCDTHTHTQNILTIKSIAHNFTPFKRILKKGAILECRDFKEFSSQNILWIFKFLLLAFSLFRLLHLCGGFTFISHSFPSG
jgi:hypothetical protein